jgi:hypothetical protein
MAIGAIGNAIFVNQQTAGVAQIQGNQNTRFDLQNVAAQAAVNERDEKVLEVRPTEENQEVDEDREHERQEADEEMKRSAKPQEEAEEEEEQDTTVGHTLDIKV